MHNAVAPTTELEVGSKLGAGICRIAVVPARALKVEGEFGGRRLPDHPGVPPDAAGKPRDPGYTDRGEGVPPPLPGD